MYVIDIDLPVTSPTPGRVMTASRFGQELETRGGTIENLAVQSVSQSVGRGEERRDESSKTED